MGYDSGFLGADRVVEVPTPASEEVLDDLVPVDGSVQIPYTHFSLALSSTRRLARWVAWNVDGARFDFADSISRDGVDFRADPRVEARFQTLDAVYADNDLDRGHLARRSDLLWGPLEEATRANEDSFFFTNISPQLSGFNQSGAAGVWGQLEDALLELATLEQLRIDVQAGPVLAATDLPYRGTLIPREFWKLLAYVSEDRLRVRAFLLTQNLDGLASLTLDDFAVYQVRLEDLGTRTSLTFDPVLVEAERADPTARAGLARPRRVSSAYDVSW